MNMQRLDTRNDAELLTEFAAKGSHAAFAVLVSRHGPMAHGIAMRVLSSHHDAQDVTQAVFILLARDARKLASSPSVAGWIHTVTRRLALNAHKSRARRQRREHTAMEHATTTAPLNSAQEAPFRRELDAAIARLPERYRQPLLLVHLEGAPMYEVAKRLALHPDTLRTRLSRARGKLRELLGQRGVEIASVTVLSSFLTNELKASSAFSPQFASTVLHGAIGGASVSPHVLALTAKGAISTSISLSAITLLMKTKTTIIIAIVVTLLAVGGATLYLSKRGDSTTTAAATPAPGSLTSSRPRKARVSPTEHPSAWRRAAEFELRFKQILLLDDGERLTALRKELGMNFSDEVYRKAVAATGYQVGKLAPELLKQWNSEDPRAATLWLNEQFFDVGIKHSLAAWLVKDEAAAMAWAKENARADDLTNALTNAESLKLEPVPLSSAEFAERMGDLRKAQEAITGDDGTARKAKESHKDDMHNLYVKWSEQDPAAAFKSFSDNLPKPMDGMMVNTYGFLIERWGQSDPDAALQWTKGIDDKNLHGSFLAKILPSWQLKHPDKSINDAADLSALSDSEYTTLVSSVVGNWATMNPKAAMDFAMSMEDPKTQRNTVTKAISAWSVKSPEEARQWITAAPAGDLRDSAILAFSKVGVVADFEATEKLVREIGNPEMKQQTISYLFFSSAAMAMNLPKTLELAREIPEFPSYTLLDRVRGIAPGDLPNYRTWIDQTAAEGRIKYDRTGFDEFVPTVADQKTREFEAAQHAKLLGAIDEKAAQK
jgi:RNA polymerase sigma factor (sigma-70 family)